MTHILYFAKVTFMSQKLSKVWQGKNPQQLAVALANITNQQVMQDFLRDAMTEPEIKEISSRLEAARLLAKGTKYTEIIEKTKLSSRTVARISDWLQNGCNGYGIAIKIAETHHSHMSPARAE